MRGGEVRAVRLKLPAFQRGGEGFTVLQAVVNRISLVAVGHDQVVPERTDRGIDDQGGVLDLRGVEGLGENFAVLLGEDPVAAVVAAAHDEIGGHGFRSVRRLADDDAASGVGVVLQQFLRGIDAVDVHRLLLFNAQCTMHNA